MENSQVQRGDAATAFKAGFWYTASNFLGKAITLITTPIFARLMTLSDYGEFINFSSWAITIVLITSLELQNTVSKAYYDFKDVFDDYISTITILGSGVTFFLYGIFLLFSKPILKIVLIPQQFVHLLFFFVALTFCRGVFNAKERTLYKYKTVAVITFISVFVPTIISIFLVYLLPAVDQLSARLYGFYVPSAMIGLYCAIALFSKSRAFKIHYCKYALFLSIPLLFNYLTGYLLISTNVVIAKNLIGAAAVAIISIAGSTAHIFTIFSQSLSGALTTWLMDNLELGNRETIQKGALFYLGLLAIVVIFTILFAPEIVFVLGGEKYVAAVILLPVFVFASFLQAATSVFTIILTYDKSVVKTAVFTGIFAVISIIAKVLLLPGNDLIILAYVNVVAFGALFCINYMLVRGAGYGDTINIKGMITILLVTGVFLMLAPYLYKSLIIRYAVVGGLVLFLLLAALKNKNYIINFAKRIRYKKSR